MDIIQELRWRGLIYQTTNDVHLAAWLMEKPRTIYAGFDPTADSLHVGHLVALMNLRRFQQCGHRPIALAGGATGTIGDPSGKSEERKLITKEQVEFNIKGIERQIRKFLRFDHSSTGALLVNNADWFSQFSYIDFLRDVGKHFPVNMMLAKDSVKMRLENSESGLSFTEFSYMLMQSYDFVHLYKTYDCEMQIGGSDQWGNITLGCEFARRIGVLPKHAQLHGLTSPLLTKSDGGKMGKTESGTLWLDPDKTSPYHFYQYWINLDDNDVEQTLKIFTNLTAPEIESVLATHRSAPEKRIAQKCLADALTLLVHSESGLAAAQKATEIFFGGEISELDDKQLNSIFANVPSKEISRQLLGNNLTITDVLIESGLATSKSDARRTIQQGGAYLNNRQVKNPNLIIGTEHLAGESVMVLRAGKKKYALVRFR
jgi:tyrosyl-tRNA synthetase